MVFQVLSKFYRSRNRRLRPMYLAVVVGVVLFTKGIDGHAQVIWDNSTGTPNPLYHNNTNWVGNSAPGSTDTAQFDINDAYEVWWSDITETITPDVGFLHVLAGDVTFRSIQLAQPRKLTINGSGSRSDLSFSGADTSLKIQGVHLHSLGGAEIVDGASVTIGEQFTGSALLTVDGGITSGFDVSGDLLVQQAGKVNTNYAFIGRNSGSTGSATVTGTSSEWNNTSSFYVGFSGTGTLDILSGGKVTSTTASIGTNNSGDGTVTVDGTGTSWNISDNLYVGSSGDGTLNVRAGGIVNNAEGRVGSIADSIGSVWVRDSGSEWNNSGDLYIGRYGSGTLLVNSIGTVSNSDAYIGRYADSYGTATVASSGTWNNSGDLYVGHSGTGNLKLASGGVTNNDAAYIGLTSGSTGSVDVSGSSTQWNSSGVLRVGSAGTGSLWIASGEVNSAHTTIGNSAPGFGTVTLTGGELNTGSLTVGSSGTGVLTIDSYSDANSTYAYIARSDGSSGEANATGYSSTWNISENLYVGGDSYDAGGTGILNIDQDSTVSVGGTTKIWETGTINLDGGRLEFGETTIAEFNTINANSGSMAGSLHHSGDTDIANLVSLQNSAVDLTDVTLTNSGALYGNASLGNAIINLSGGELETSSGERMRFAGTGSNAGEINNFGGRIRFDQDLVNSSAGFISGRGIFTANGGWTNEGVMAFSGGFTDIHGDIDNQSTGQIVTSGGGITTFYDDVVHNGVEIRTAANSMSVFFGEVTGAGPFTGTGTVFFEGDLRPGNSPAAVHFDGGLVFGSGAGLYVELGGEEPGLFDQLIVDGDLALDGQLQVDLIDGFQLDFNDHFLVADVGGTLQGQFSGLDEGALIGNFSGMDLFISYEGGDGNDVLFYTPVPEPGMIHVLGFISAAAMFYRRRKALATV